MLGGLERSVYRDSFYAYMRAAWPHIESAPYIDNWHVGAVCEHLQAVTLGQISKLLINIPPGCSKSLITCVFWPTWEWQRDPSVRWFFASYDQQLSTRDSVKCRTLLSSPWYQAMWPGRVVIKRDQDQKTYYETTAGGYRLATSVGGHGTGEHPDRVVFDDPHNVRKAESEVERQNVIDWWDLTMPTRGLSRGVRQVGIMQRLHHRDLAGHIISRGDFVLLCLPMRYEPNRMVTTVLGWNDPRTVEGELLAPVQFPEEKIRSLEKSLGAYGVAGQLQQRPQPRGGGLFKPQWFNRRNRAAPREAVRVRAWDRASTNEGGCYTAGVLMAKDKDGTLYVEDCVHGQWEPNERNDRIIATAKKDRLRYGPKWEPIIVVEMERGSTGLESFQRLAARLVGYKIKEDRPTGSKDVRAEPWADQLAAGNVVICDNGGEPLWDIANYVTEHEQFKPDSKVKRLGKYKDQVDASSMACNWLANKSAEPAEARVIRFRTTDRNKPKHPRVVVSSYASLPNIDADQKTMLTVIHDPFTEKPEEARFLPSIPNLIDTHFSAFADLNPGDYQDAWEQPVEPYGKPPAELVIAREHGKSIWKALLKSQPTPELFIFVSPNGNRADAIAKAFMDVLRIPRDGLHYADSDNEEGKHKQPPANQHVYDVMRIARGAIL